MTNAVQRSKWMCRVSFDSVTTALSKCLQWQSKLPFLLLQCSCSPLQGDNNIWTLYWYNA